jgi:DNA-binding transcriptional ArsR family regulator
MEVEEKFISMAGLICEPTRAKLLWNLLDGRAYTASELASSGDISSSAASNHLSKLLEADIVKVEIQGRHRYYSFSNPEVAYVVETLANLVSNKRNMKPNNEKPANGVKYCRTCYDHLAGYVGVTIAEAMEQNGYLKKSENLYLVNKKGWEWFAQFDILQKDFTNARRPINPPVP